MMIWIKRRDVLDILVRWRKKTERSEKEKDLLKAVMYDICHLPSAQIYTESETQRLQELEQAQIQNSVDIS